MNREKRQVAARSWRRSEKAEAKRRLPKDSNQRAADSGQKRPVIPNVPDCLSFRAVFARNLGFEPEPQRQRQLRDSYPAASLGHAVDIATRYLGMTKALSAIGIPPSAIVSSPLLSFRTRRIACHSELFLRGISVLRLRPSRCFSRSRFGRSRSVLHLLGPIARFLGL